MLRLYDVLREYARARLVADLERIAKAARGHEQRALAAALEERIGGDRCPHLDGANDASRNWLSSGEGKKPSDRLNCGVRISRALGQELHRMQPPARVATDHIGERPAAIDPEVPGGAPQPDLVL